MADQTSPDKLTHKRGQVRGDGVHAVAEVLCELRAVGSDGDDLVTQGVDMRYVGIGDLSAHRYLGGGF